MAPVSITTAELLDALAAAQRGNGPEHARTVMEMCGETGMCQATLRRALLGLQAQGRLQSFQVVRPALGGRMSRVPAYTILPAAKPKRAK